VATYHIKYILQKKNILVAKSMTKILHIK